MKQAKTEIYESIIELNVDDLPKGIYLVEVKNETGNLVQKLIIE